MFYVYLYTYIMLQNEIIVLNFIFKNIVQFQMKLKLSAKMHNYFANNLTRRKKK